VRPVMPLGSAAIEYADIAVDPETDVSCGYRRWLDVDTGFLWGTFTALYGVAKVDGNRLVRIVSA